MQTLVQSHLLQYVPKAISGIYDCGVYKNL